MTEISFGRLENSDSRDELYPVSAILQETPDIPEKYWWANGWWGNQGSTSQCFLGDSKVLLSNGRYKRIDEIVVGDEVVTHKGRYKKVTETFHRLYNGKLTGIKYQGNKNFLYSTEEHPYYISEVGVDWSSKKSLTYGKKIIKNQGWVTSNKIKKNKHAVNLYRGGFNSTYSNGDVINVGGYDVKITKDFMYFLGLYLAEGYCSKERYNEVCFAFHEKELQYQNFISNFIKDTFNVDCKVSIRESHSCAVVFCYSKKIRKILEYFGGKFSHKKEISEELFECDDSLLQKVYDGFNDGDGYIKYNKNGDIKNIILTTVSKKLSQNLYDIALRLGHNVSLQYQDPKQKDNSIRRRCYRIVSYFNSKHTRNIFTEKFVSATVKKIEKDIYFSGMVYNIEVEDDNSYILDNCAVHNCVVYSWMHWLEDGPVIQDAIPNRPQPMYDTTNFYHACQDRDPWEGREYNGTSVRAGAKILKELGIISEYRWARTINDVVNTVLTLGPMVVGTKWYSSMSRPNSKGIMTPTGKQNGGHAYLINGVDKVNRFFRVKNSWGQNWGKKGYAFISFDDFETLLNDGGEACIAFENKLFEVPDLETLPPA